MAFNIYDPLGYRYPYHPESEWRNVTKPQEALPHDETKLEQKRKKRKKIKDVLEKADEEETKRTPPPPSEEILVASQIMKRNVITITPGTTLKEAWHIFHTKRIGHLPVLNKEGKLVGIITDRQLLREVGPLAHEKHHHSSKMKVQEIMTSPVLTAQPSTEVSMIAKIFIKEKISSIPIVDENHNLIGILTRTDILRTLVKVDILDIQA